MSGLNSSRGTALVNSGTVSTVEQAVNRLIADPSYRTEVAVSNNYPAVLANYQRVRMMTDRPGLGTLAARLNSLRSKFPEQVDAILDVPFVPGKSDIFDGAYQQLDDMVTSNENSIERTKNEEGSQSSGFLLGGLAAGINGLAQVAGLIFGGRAADEAADAERERLQQVAYLQQQQDAARAEQTKRIVKGTLIGLAIVGAIIVVVIYIRRRGSKG